MAIRHHANLNWRGKENVLTAAFKSSVIFLLGRARVAEFERRFVARCNSTSLNCALNSQNAAAFLWRKWYTRGNKKTQETHSLQFTAAYNGRAAAFLYVIRLTTYYKYTNAVESSRGSNYCERRNKEQKNLLRREKQRRGGN